MLGITLQACRHATVFIDLAEKPNMHPFIRESRAV